jgi:5-methylcytosine-specific restriction endonuclease McrA
MKKLIHEFYTEKNDPINTFRTILLFGKNVSTYKFALCSALLSQNTKSEIRYSDLTNSFLNELYRHYEVAPQQWTGGANIVTNSFDKYKEDGNWDELVKVAEANVYKYVFDAFHNIGGSSVSDNHLLFEHNKKDKKLIFTDSLNSILDNHTLKAIILKENESRWLVVEEAWKNGLSPNLLEYNSSDNNLYSFNIIKGSERTNLRSAVDVLLPYQKGYCFYCNKKINANASKEQHDFPDVDHFWPFSFLNKFDITPLHVNGIWNLVISCQECNRGGSGKFDSPPSIDYFHKLLNRNLLFTEEHRHSLKNSILISMGALNSGEVESRMLKIYNLFYQISGWKPKKVYEL